MHVVRAEIAHYRIVRQIGAGGMGTVYLALDTRLQRHVALKFLPAESVGSPDGAARLLREARAASALDHPHIATIYEIGTHDGRPFIAMAYYEGETLAGRLARAPLAMAEIAKIVVQISDALDAAHAANIVHRDLKPANLMVTPTAGLKVLDFGIAKIETAETGTQLTHAGTAMGTAAYMSPEQAAGEVVDRRSDIWSLGVVIYEMLTGRLPFDRSNLPARMHAVLTSTPTPVRTLRPDVAPELEEIVSRSLARDRDERTITAADVHDLAASCLARLSSGRVPMTSRPPGSRWMRIAVVAVALALAASGITWWAQRTANVRWARHEALPDIVRLAGADRFDEAFALAQRAQAFIPDDPLLAEQWRAISRTATVSSDPAGANVFFRPYRRSDEPWRFLGQTPIAGANVPRGLLHWKVEMPGRPPVEDVGPGPFDQPHMHFTLFPSEQVPAGMVRISSASPGFRVSIPGLEHLPEVNLPDYWIDRHEVTNREYKKFVDEGGYRRPELWSGPFVQDGRPLTFEAAMARFRDATGRPGPATWELGSYVAGQDEHPVAGVSWHEAAAYARWAGKSLPSLYHWSRAADQRLSGDVVPASNVGGKSLLPVGASRGITHGGTIDMAGNVKEWCLTAAGAERYILGGSWNEVEHMFNDVDAHPPFARDPTYGFRCIKVDRPEDLSASLTARVGFPSRDLRNSKPVNRTAVQEWSRLLYSFDHGNLNARVEAVDDSSPDWRMEKVSYAAAYGGERIPAYLFLPKQSAPPYQVVLYFPGASALYERSSASISDHSNTRTFFMRSGRALLYPVYKSTFERYDGTKSDIANGTASWRDHMIMWSKDVGRSVDYLESRADIDKDKIGYFGASWGAEMAPLFLAVEPRLNLGILHISGLNRQPALPEADPVNFEPLVRVPILMLNGRYDFFYPTATSQEPMFQLLGTPSAHKRRIVYETSHNIPRNELIKEVVGWLDKYWGPPPSR